MRNWRRARGSSGLDEDGAVDSRVGGWRRTRPRTMRADGGEQMTRASSTAPS